MIPQIPYKIEELVQMQQNAPQQLPYIDEQVRSFALQWLDEHGNSLENSPINDQLQSLRKVLQDEPLQDLPSFLEDWIKDTDSPSQEVISFFKECTLPNYIHCMSHLLDKVPLEKLWPVFDNTFNREDILQRVLLLLFDRILTEKVLEFLAKPGSRGYSLLYFPKVIKALLDECFDKVPAEKILELLGEKDVEEGDTPLHGQETVQVLFDACPDKISADQVMTLLQIQDKRGATPLHFPGAVQALLDACPDKVSTDQVMTLLQMQDTNGRIPLRFPGDVQALLDACPDKVSTDQAIALLQIENKSGKTPLGHYQERNLEVLKEVLDAHDKQLEFNLLSQVLRLQNQKGEFILFAKEDEMAFEYANLQEILQLVPERIRIDELFVLLRAQDDIGRTILHRQRDLSSIISLLNQYPSKEWTEIFSLRDSQGNTALHDCNSLSTIKQVLEHLDPSVIEIPNSSGEMLLDKLFSVSKTWLQAPKTTVVQEHLNEEEFQARANALKETILSFWNDLAFGEEERQIPLMFLSFNSNEYTKDQVREALTTMLDRICQKEAWLGTPPLGDLEALCAFYTPMLLNFEKIAQKLQEKEDPNEIAGALFDIAKTQLEGRCAAAYQGEIEQACSLILGEEADLSTEALLETSAKNALVEAIEKIMRDRNSTDVHTYNQLAYAAGILPVEDPLSYFTVYQCLEMLEENWTSARLAESFNKVSKEQLFDWFKEKTEVAFGAGYFALEEEVKFQEAQILFSTKGALLQKDVSEESALAALEFFRSSRGASLVLEKTLVDTDQGIKEALTQAVSNFSEEDLNSVLEEELSHLEEKGWQGVFTSIRQTLEIPPQRRLAWQMMSQTFIKSLENTQKIQQEPFLQNLTDAQKRAVLEEKQRFDGQMKALVDQLTKKEGVDLSINLKEHGLPSKGVESSRKAAFAASFFSEEKQELQLTKCGIYFIGKEIGVLEEVS